MIDLEDAEDLRALQAIAAQDDWEVAERAVQLIVDRGYARGRDLPQALQVLRDHGAY